MDNNQPNNPDDDFRAASEATAHEPYGEQAHRRVAHGAPKPAGGRGARLTAIITVVVIGILGLGLSLGWFLLKDKRSTGSKEIDAPASSQKMPEDKPLISDKTKHYTSPRFMLEFDHPADWQAEEAATGDKLSVRSPALQLHDETGQSFTGRIIFMVRNKQQALPEFDAGNAVAVLESQKITYLKPSSVQRAATYISFLQYASASRARLDGIYVSGDVGYQKNQAIPKADFVPVDPIISLTFIKCTDNACTAEGAPVSIDPALWQDKAFGGPLTALFTSLVVN